MNIKN